MTVEPLLKALAVTINVAKFAKSVTRFRLPDRVQIDTSRTSESLVAHARAVQEWAATIQVDPVSAPKRLADIYVDLNLRVFRPARGRRPDLAITVDDLADVEESMVLLGHPGAGKTTAVKRLLTKILNQRTKRPRFPLLVTLRSLGVGESLVDHLCAITGIRIDIPGDNPRALRQHLQLQSLAALFERVGTSVFLDGLDEVPIPSLPPLVDELNQLLQHAPRTRFLITCRKSAYVHTVSNAMTLELEPLTEPQVRELSSLWLTADQTNVFIERLSHTPYTGAELRPLVLAVLLLLFIRSGDVPKRPKTVYEKVTRLFLEDWDAAKNVKRHSRYADFPIDRKEEFLEALAFVLTTEGRRGEFSHDDLLGAYEAIHAQFGLPRAQARAVVSEIESHTGLITQLGQDEYTFFHLTIHEYLTARFIVRSGVICPPGIRVSEHPNEYAVAVGYSSSPSVFCREVIQRYLLEKAADRSADASGRFEQEFVLRLLTEAPNWKVDETLGAAMCMLISTNVGIAFSLNGLWADLNLSIGVRDSVRLFLKTYTRIKEAADQRVDYVMNYAKVDEQGSADLVMFLDSVKRPARLPLWKDT